MIKIIVFQKDVECGKNFTRKTRKTYFGKEILEVRSEL
jgi:hypothetical protein